MLCNWPPAMFTMYRILNIVRSILSLFWNYWWRKKNEWCFNIKILNIQDKVPESESLRFKVHRYAHKLCLRCITLLSRCTLIVLWILHYNNHVSYGTLCSDSFRESGQLFFFFTEKTAKNHVQPKKWKQHTTPTLSQCRIFGRKDTVMRGRPLFIPLVLKWA
jgi:hypothetical protein